MKKIFPFLTLTLLFFVLFYASSCSRADKLEIEKSAAAFDIKQGEASIKQSNQLYMKSFKAGDSVAVSNCYTSEAKLMLANMPSIKGRSNILHFISMAMKKGLTECKLTTLDIWGDSSMLVEEGTYKTFGEDSKELDNGKYLVLWQQEAGNWKMYRHMWNSNLPEESFKLKQP